MCTVSGSTVIDFHGNDQTITHRCAYTLLSVASETYPDVDVVAVFQERRRTDVPLLSHVLLLLKDDGITVTLEQGRVTVGDDVQTLSDTPETVSGVELSKDGTGVTAKIPYYGEMIPVFFDGVTVQIDITGYTDDASGGLCGNPTDPSGSPPVSVSTVKDSTHSDDDCETPQTEDPDSSLDCDTMTVKCNLLMQEPFTACNMHIDPEPYISACTDILCNYPAGDDLLCQLLEAYARTCSSHSSDTLDGWRETAGCSATPTAFCPDTYCTSDEFCGEKRNNNGVIENVCLCRAIFASENSLDVMFGYPTVCEDSYASFSLPRCVLEENNIDYTDLHLNDDACTGYLDDDTHMVTFSFSGDTCSTVVTTSNNQLLFKNTISIDSTDDGTITRNDDVQIDFSCYSTQTADTSMDIGIRIRDSSVSEVIESGEWIYTLTMNAYLDSDRTQAITSSTEINLDQTIWVELSTDGLDDNAVAVVTDSCWATNEASSSGSLRYDLITSGCADTDDGTVAVEGNGAGTSNYFSFNMFQFSEQTSDVYLHCQLKLCALDDGDCVPDCNPARRRRRSLVSNSEDMSPALITMAWTK
ncbi:uromodulin-like [Centroberyx gerrardi]